MRILKVVLMLVASGALGACGSFHIHNTAREADAAAAKADYDASKYGDAIKSQRTVLAALEQGEIAASRKYIHALRDTALVGLATDSELLDRTPTPATGFIARFAAKTEARLSTLDGPPTTRRNAHLDAWGADRRLVQATKEEQRARAGLISAKAEFKDLPACGDELTSLAKGPDHLAAMPAVADRAGFGEFVRAAWEPSLRDEMTRLVTTCSNITAAQTKLASSPAEPGGLLAAAIKDRDDAINKFKADKASQAQRKTELEAAADELAAVSKQRTTDGKLRDYTCPEVSASTVAKEGATKEPPTRLCQALANLEKLGALGKQVIAQEKVDRIRVILSAMSGVTPKPGADHDVDSSLALIAAATRLGHALDTYHRAETWPAIEPLIIEKQLADAQLASATAQVALSADRVTYHEEIVDAIKLEITLLTRAHSTIGGYGKSPVTPNATCPSNAPRHCSSLEALLRSNGLVNGVPEERVAYRAMALLSESYVARDRQRTAQVRLNATGYREALILAEESVGSWKALLDTPMEQLKAYHAGGLKPAELAPLLQAIGIFGIANGVN
ncbi:hypothetical protein [Telluria aromaticivorans]|uniref:Lipoprotein n=1 Tax=Telluria aromaticivorans TaxID=2725995 RepID=A0A7Y2K2M6_9BURK|nr:hypothetical protein [Telluria aromaticivorans]NNG25546.1 hypothetical protein [Telluria aromaticivorans]